LGFETLDSIKRVTETRDKKQAVLVIGFRGTTVRDADRYPLELLQEACSDLGSRLFMRIREKLGLAYYVGAQNVLGLAPGYFAFYAGTEPEKAGQVETELLSEAELLRERRAHRRRTQTRQGQGHWPTEDRAPGPGRLRHDQRARRTLRSRLRHTDTEDALYEAVTLEQVKAVARKYLKPDALVIAVVRPEE
jgi:zinc protease